MSEARAFYASLGRRIQHLRKARGLTQEQLGSRILPPVTRASIANVEAGKQGVLAHTLVQLANALGVSAEDLLPKDTTLEQNPNLREQVQDELAKKLSVPRAESKRLTDKLLANPATMRRKYERSTRTSPR